MRKTLGGSTDGTQKEKRVWRDTAVPMTEATATGMVKELVMINGAISPSVRCI